jgi:hypothetical protein
LIAPSGRAAACSLQDKTQDRVSKLGQRCLRPAAAWRMA